MMNYIFGKENRTYWMGLAMIFIILAHITMYVNAQGFIYKFMKMVFIQGNSGVNVFFLVSAYGLCHSLVKNPLRTFYLHRFKRLFPIWPLFVIAEFYFLMPVKDPLFCVWQVTGLSVFIDYRRMLAWYIPALIVVYLIFPFLYKYVKHIKEKPYGDNRLLLLIVLITFSYYFVNPYLRPSLYSRIPVILLGISSYLYQLDGNIRAVGKLYAGTAILSLLTYNDCEFYCFVPLVLFVLSEYQVKMVAKKVVCFIGQHSLEIYLGQVIGLQYLLNTMHGKASIDTLICLAISVVAAIAFYLVQSGFWKLFCKNKQRC